MIYQLPDGRVIHLSVEEFLRMDKELEQSYIASNLGHSANSPFYQSVITKPEREIDPDDEHDSQIDFIPETDEFISEEPFDINNIPDEDGLD